MIRVLIDASSFEILPIQHGQNPYINIGYHAEDNEGKIRSQHQHVVEAYDHTPVVLGTIPPRHCHLPDIVFLANGGLSLPRLRNPLILMPNMKYQQRRDELPYLKRMYHRMGLKTVDYPGYEPFEGQAELKWFHGGRRAICGYGFRATKKSFEELDRFFERLYGKDKKPELLVIRLISPDYYHLDVAMLEFDDAKCVIHRHAVTPASLRRIQRFLGDQNVTVLDTSDSFCLNAVVDGPNLLTHKMRDPKVRPLLERITGRRVKEINTSEFEKSGGSVRCMTLDVHA